jgi:hypothetical protein
MPLLALAAGAASSAVPFGLGQMCPPDRRTSSGLPSETLPEHDESPFDDSDEAPDYVLIIMGGKGSQSGRDHFLGGEFIDEDDQLSTSGYEENGTNVAAALRSTSSTSLTVLTDGAEFWIAPRRRLLDQELMRLQQMNSHDVERCGSAPQRAKFIRDLFRRVGFRRVRDLYAAKRRNHVSISRFISLIYFVRL